MIHGDETLALAMSGILMHEQQSKTVWQVRLIAEEFGIRESEACPCGTLEHGEGRSLLSSILDRT